MKKFEICVGNYVKHVYASCDIDAAEDVLTYRILKYTPRGGTGYCDVRVMVELEDAMEQFSISLPDDCFASEAEDIIWERIAEDYVVEIK